MALTDHQKLHLSAIVSEMDEGQKKDRSYKDRISKGKEVEKEKIDDLLKQQGKIAKKILSDDELPGDFDSSLKDYMLHDYVEEKATEIVKNG